MTPQEGISVGFSLPGHVSTCSVSEFYLNEGFPFFINALYPVQGYLRIGKASDFRQWYHMFNNCKGGYDELSANSSC